MDYLAALERPSLALTTVDGELYTARRASLKGFFVLLGIMLNESVTEDERKIEYVAYALSVEPCLVAGWFALDVDSFFEAIRALNTPNDIHLDYTRQEGGDGKPKYTYKNRALAYIVTRLASAFGWTKDYILDELTYDEARCYLQELELESHNEHEFAWMLSPIGVNAKGQKTPFTPLPFPPEIPTTPVVVAASQPPAPTNPDLVPQGVVLTAEDIMRQYG